MAISGAVFRYYLYKATEAVEFYRPIMYLYFLSQGLSFTQIVIIEALYNLATVLGRCRQDTSATESVVEIASSSGRHSLRRR